MFINAWLKKIVRTVRQLATSTTNARTSQSSQERLRYEPLEARQLLTTFFVDNLDDAGAGSLRQAISDANATAGADVIQFDAGIAGGTVSLTTGELSITDSVDIQGLGSGITVDAQGNSRVFNINDGNDSVASDVSISGLTITGGNTGDDINSDEDKGGGIRSSESLTLDQVNITGNTAADFGGGVFAQDGVLTITGSTVSNNTVTFEEGGGIGAKNSNVSISNTSVTGNNAAADDGGGIWFVVDLVDGSSRTLDLRTVSVSDNAADRDGGGLYVDRGSDPGSTQVIIQDSEFLNNFGDTGSGGARLEGEVQITDTSFENNITNDIGGAIVYDDNQNDLIITGGMFAGNSAGDQGGAFYVDDVLNLVIDSVSVVNNTTTSDGGGIAIADVDGVVEITNSTIANNSSDDSGGGIFDLADYTVWRDALGSAGPLDNETASPGVVDAADYQVWKGNFGTQLASPLASAQVPEPASFVLFGVTLVLLRSDRLNLSAGRHCGA